MSVATVARAWRHFGVEPLPCGRFRFDTRPGLEVRSVTVVAMLPVSVGKVVVLRTDQRGAAEPTAVRADPMTVPVSTERAQWRRPQTTAVDLVRWCAATYPDEELHVVADPVARISLQQGPAMRTWWALHSRISLHGVGDSVSWAALTEGWLAAGA